MNAETAFFGAEALLRGYGQNEQVATWLAVFLTVRVFSHNQHLYPEVLRGTSARIPEWQEFMRNPRDALQKTLDEAPFETLDRIFDDIEAAQIPDTILTRTFFGFDNIAASSFKNLEELRVTCGPLIDALLLRKGYRDSSEYFTQTAPARLSALLTNSEHVRTIHDPTCGYGVALTSFRALNHREDIQYSGQDKNGNAIALATMRLLMHGIQRFDLRVGDTLTDPYPIGALISNLPRFDVVITDPPLNAKVPNYNILENDRYRRFKYGAPSRRSVEWSFIQHALASLTQGGVATVLTSASALFRKGTEAQTRKNIISDDLLEAVIALPSGVFAATSIVGYLLVFNTNKPGMRRDHVLFIDASSSPPDWGDGIKGEWSAGLFVEYAFAAYRDGRSTDDLQTNLVSKQTIIENDADLSPKRYLSLAAAPVAPSLEQIEVLQGQALEAWNLLELSRVEAANAWQAVLAEGGRRFPSR